MEDDEEAEKGKKKTEWKMGRGGGYVYVKSVEKRGIYLELRRVNKLE